MLAWLLKKVVECNDELSTVAAKRLSFTFEQQSVAMNALHLKIPDANTLRSSATTFRRRANTGTTDGSEVL